MLNHHPNYCKCSLCGNVRCEVRAFKQGHICETCLAFVRDEYRNIGRD